MFLRSLHLNGFKSFADNTKLEFHPGVTGVVGPNGCGKSNVVDAIRWVLGETSAKALRGGEMADVIFNGTEKRKPLGMAEVLLTLGDCEGALGVDFNEVCVGRRVYRDGKSEYLLNNKPCRLKDINNLFMDTGIGRSSYSVMEQGKIDMLLSSKPEDRRQVFEEAAGITKFKQQKKEALRKLDYTEANLVRIVDVLEEQKRQMGSLQRQAAKARRYATLLEQVRVLDTHFSHRQFAELRAERGELITSIGALRTQHDELQTQIEGGQTGLNETRAAFQAIEGEISDLRQRESELQGKIQEAKSRIQFNEERGVEMRTLIERNEADIASSREKLETQRNDLTAADETLKTMAEQIGKQEADVGRRLQQTDEIRRERGQVELALNENRSQLGKAESLVTTLAAQLENGLSQMTGSQQRVSQLADEKGRIEAERATKRGELAELEKAKAEQEKLRNDLELELKLLEDGLVIAQRDLAAARESEANLTREVTEKQTRLETLQQLVAMGEGFEKGTQEVLKWKDECGGMKDETGAAVQGVIANFIDVEPKFIPAIEAALGQHLQAVMVAHSLAAKDILERLRSGELGQASLVPNDLMTEQESEPELSSFSLHPSSLGKASDFVNADLKVEAVVQGLLRNILVVESLDLALSLRAELPGVGFVTLAGEFLSESGVLTGGFKEQGAGSVLERQSEIRSLENATAKIRSKLEAEQKRVTSFDDLVAESQVDVEAHRERLQKLKVDLSTVDGQLAMVQREVQQQDSKLESLTWEESELVKRMELAQTQQSDLEAQKVQARETIEQLETETGQLQTRHQTIREKEEEATVLLNELRTALAVEKRARESLEQQRAPMSSRLRELEESIQRRVTEIDGYKQRVDQGAKENEQLRGDIESLSKQRTEVMDQRGGLETKRGGLLTEIEQGEAKLVTMRQQVAKMAEQRGNEEIRSTQLELRMENLSDTVQQRYQVELESFEADSHALLGVIAEVQKKLKTPPGEEPAPDPEMPEIPDDSQPDWKFVAEATSELRRKLDGMGPVNLDAIQEYDELEERYSMMVEQHDDLVKSKDELLKVIEKINKTTKAMFAETFVEVSKNFREMFTELFGKGAQANLVLLDDDDPLESGIEIIAKPPGKKLQSISLLSGGERSMTAVALLFAIYMVKPSPFCVLDELDAPLDEANIERFIRVLDRFINDSQFIIVTHSKRTMSRCDVMYGVSMEEFGISKTLGMKFSSSDGEKQSASGGNADSATVAESVEPAYGLGKG